MKSKMRRYQSEEDYRLIRDFLRKVTLLNNRREKSWHVARFDYWRWHGIENQGDGKLEKDVFIWEGPDKEIVAVLNREEEGRAFFQIHPDFKTPILEKEMLAVAEKHLLGVKKSGKKFLWIWTDSKDAQCQEILKKSGYQIVPEPETKEHQRRQEIRNEIPEPSVPEGYNVRSLGGVDELPSRSRASYKAFHPDAPDDKYGGWEWYLNIQRAPLYRRDLDMVAVSPKKEIVSFTTVWFDDVTKTAYFEPVGTHPAHRKRGLGKAVMTEGLRRLKQMGCILAFVGGYSKAANALYSSAGFKDFDLSEPWVKEF
jgi:mycothiol synthase